MPFIQPGFGTQRFLSHDIENYDILFFWFQGVLSLG